MIEITDFHVLTQPRKSTINATGSGGTGLADAKPLPIPRLSGHPNLMASQPPEGQDDITPAETLDDPNPQLRQMMQ